MSSSLPTQTTALRVLLCRDIVVEIFEEMSPFWIEDYPHHTETDVQRQKSWRRSLASCACVCRAFSGPALDVLWRVLDDVDVALQVLPSFQKASSKETPHVSTSVSQPTRRAFLMFPRLAHWHAIADYRRNHIFSMGSSAVVYEARTRTPRHGSLEEDASLSVGSSRCSAQRPAPLSKTTPPGYTVILIYPQTLIRVQP